MREKWRHIRCHITIRSIYEVRCYEEDAGANIAAMRRREIFAIRPRRVTQARMHVAAPSRLPLHLFYNVASPRCVMLPACVTPPLRARKVACARELEQKVSLRAEQLSLVIQHEPRCRTAALHRLAMLYGTFARSMPSRGICVTMPAPPRLIASSAHSCREGRLVLRRTFSLLLLRGDREGHGGGAL